MKNYHVVLTRGEWEKIRPAVLKSGILCEPSGYGESVYLSVTCDIDGFQKMEEILSTL